MKTKIDQRFPMARRLQNKTVSLYRSRAPIPEYIVQAYRVTNATVGALYSAAIYARRAVK